MWYELIRDVPAGSELLVAPKVPLQLHDVINRFGSQNQYNSDRDTGEHKKIIVSVFFACNRMYIIKATTARVVSTESSTNYTRRLDLSRDEVINQNNSIEK